MVKVFFLFTFKNKHGQSYAHEEIFRLSGSTTLSEVRRAVKEKCRNICGKEGWQFESFRIRNLHFRTKEGEYK